MVYHRAHWGQKEISWLPKESCTGGTGKIVKMKDWRLIRSAVGGFFPSPAG